MTTQTEKMTKITKILSAAFMVFMLAQIALMFLPYFKFTDLLDEHHSVSLQGWVWIECGSAAMNSYFKQFIEGFKFNEHFGGLVLTFACGLVGFVTTLMDFVGMFTDDTRPVASAIGQIFSALWLGLGLATFLGEEALLYGDLTIRTAGIIVLAVAAVVYLARLYPWFCAKFGKKAVKE